MLIPAMAPVRARLLVPFVETVLRKLLQTHKCHLANDSLSWPELEQGRLDYILALDAEIGFETRPLELWFDALCLTTTGHYAFLSVEAEDNVDGDSWRAFGNICSSVKEIVFPGERLWYINSNEYGLDDAPATCDPWRLDDGGRLRGLTFAFSWHRLLSCSVLPNPGTYEVGLKRCWDILKDRDWLEAGPRQWWDYVQNTYSTNPQRFARDGVAYSFFEFIQWYGKDYAKFWEEAPPADAQTVKLARMLGRA